MDNLKKYIYYKTLANIVGTFEDSWKIPGCLDDKQSVYLFEYMLTDQKHRKRARAKNPFIKDLQNDMTNPKSTPNEMYSEFSEKEKIDCMRWYRTDQKLNMLLSGKWKNHCEIIAQTYPDLYKQIVELVVYARYYCNGPGEVTAPSNGFLFDFLVNKFISEPNEFQKEINKNI
jgi:hypothetical protein